jgi:hypothetical protein
VRSDHPMMILPYILCIMLCVPFLANSQSTLQMEQ